MITIIDYSAGNLRSVEKALLSLGETFVITRDRKTILKAGKATLFGVGSLGDATGKLKQYDLMDVTHETVDRGTPFLDIYLGPQFLFASSEEGHGAAGLGILPEEMPKILEHPGPKTPHMGWDPLEIRPETKLFYRTEDGAYIYFVRSYCLKAEDESAVAASTECSTIVHVSVERGDVFACQFHPEKSGKVGLTILKNLIGLQKPRAA